jgi:hypothetical protein
MMSQPLELACCKGCPNKSARFNFVIKRTIYSKSVDIFIAVYSTHTAINCGTQYPQTSPTTLLAHSCSFDEILDDIST